MVQLSASDYREMLDFLRVALESDASDAFPVPVVDALKRLLPCETVSYHEWDRSGRYRGRISADDPAAVSSVWRAYPLFRFEDPLPSGLPNAMPHGRVPYGRALKFSDFMSLDRFRSLDLHREVCRPLGIDYVMKIFLPTADGGCSFVFDSRGRDFSERDRAVLEALAPHLVRLNRRAETQAAPAAENGVTSALTQREREVLRLVAAGLSNREIAATLFVAGGTVRKHLDNIYRKLGVTSRTAAVAAAFIPDGASRYRG